MGIFDFGKKRRSVKRRSSKSLKPPARLLKICKRYHVKATKKVGGKRMYKRVSVLKKLCLRKAMAIRKKLMKLKKTMMKRKKMMKHGRKTSRKVSHRRKSTRKVRRSDDSMMFGMRRRTSIGTQHMMPDGTMMDGTMFGMRRRRRSMGFGADWANDVPMKGQTPEKPLIDPITYPAWAYAQQCMLAGYKPAVSCKVNDTKFGRRRRRSMGFGLTDLPLNASQQMLDSVKQYPQLYNNLKNSPLFTGGIACGKAGGSPYLTCKAKTTTFGKRRLSGGRSVGRKTGRAVAMKAFRSFYKRHCAGRRAGFGNGGNPPLYQSMGGEFCPDGQGGILSGMSTGLFPSPCVSASSSGPAGTAYGRRRKVRRRSAIGTYPKGSKKMVRGTMMFGLKKKPRSRYGVVSRRSAIGSNCDKMPVAYGRRRKVRRSAM